MQQVRGCESRTHAAGNGAVMVSDYFGDVFGQWSCPPSAQCLDKETGFDADWTRGRAQSAASAGVDAVIIVQGAQCGELGAVTRAHFEPCDLAPADYSMQRSTIASQAGRGLRFFRCASRSLLRITPGFSKPSGSNRRLICHIRAYA